MHSFVSEETKDYYLPNHPMIIPDNPNVDPAFAQKVYDKFHRGESVFGVTETMEITRGTGVFSTPRLQYKYSLLKARLDATLIFTVRLEQIQDQLRKTEKLYALLNKVASDRNECHMNIAQLNRLKRDYENRFSKLKVPLSLHQVLFTKYKDVLYLIRIKKRLSFLKFEEQRLKKERHKKFEYNYRTNPFRNDYKKT